MTDSTEEKGNKGVQDLKSRLGLNRKLKEIDEARKAKVAPEALDPDNIAQPPRRTFDANSAPITDTGQPIVVDEGAITKKSPMVLVLTAIVAALVVLLAGYTIGKAFQMRVIANARIMNAQETHRLVFAQGHPTAVQPTMEIFLAYVDTVKTFRDELDKKAKDAAKQSEVLADMRSFIAKVREYRALNIEFSARQAINKSYYLIEVVPTLVTLQNHATRINALSDAIVEDAAVLDFIERYQKDRVDKPDKYQRFFWFAGAPEDDPEAYGKAHLVLKMAQKEMRKEGRKKWMEQAIIPETAEKKDEGVMVPVRNLAPIQLGAAIQTYEDKVVHQMLKSLRVRLDALAETSRGVNVEFLKKKLEEFGGKDAYFVL